MNNNLSLVFPPQLRIFAFVLRKVPDGFFVCVLVFNHAAPVFNIFVAFGEQVGIIANHLAVPVSRVFLGGWETPKDSLAGNGGFPPIGPKNIN